MTHCNHLLGRLLFMSLVVMIFVPTVVMAQVSEYDALRSETPHFEQITESLSSLNINKIIEDDQSVLWIATNNGITRYDGLRTRTFASTDDDDIQERRVVLALADDTISNCIWASLLSEQVLLRIDKHTLKMTELAYDIPINNRPNISSLISELVAFNDSLLLAFSPFQLNLVHKSTGEHYTLWKPDTQSLTTSNASSLFSVGSRRFALASSKMFELLDETDTLPNGKVVPLRLREIHFHLSGARVAKAVSDTSVIVACGNATSNSNLTMWFPNSGRDSLVVSLPMGGRDVCVTRSDFWVCTNKGLVRIPINGGGRYRVFSTVNSKIADGNLSCALRLRHQPILFLGAHSGLIKMDYLLGKFSSFDFRKMSRSAIAEVSCVLKDSRDNYWACTRDGLFFRSTDQLLFERAEVRDVDMKGDRVVSIIETCEHDAILVAQNNHVVMTDSLGRTSRIVFRTPDNNKIASVRALPGRRARILTAYSVFTLDLDTRKADELDLPTRVNVCHISDDDNIWYCGIDKRIVHVDMKDKSVKTYGVVGTPIATALRHTDKNGMDEVWICTRRDGLRYYLPSADTIVTVTSSRYLRTATSIEVAADGSLWAGSESGIVHLKDNIVEEYSNSIYDIANFFVRSSSTSASDPNVRLFCLSTGFVEFTPAHFVVNDYFPSPRISSYGLANSVSKTYDVFIADDVHVASDSVVVPAGVRSLKLHLAAPNYHQTMSCLVQWQMDFDETEEWHTQPLAQDINLTNLDEGCHTLRMRSLNAEGKPMPEVSNFYIVREVFFYETLWFRVLSAVCVVLFAIMSVFAYGVHNLRQKRKLEDEVARQAGLIIEANRELRHSQEVIRKQYDDLAEANNTLELKVEERTAALEKAKQKAEESNELKSAFLASLGHEVRTPMNAIVGFAKLLQMDDCHDEERREFAHLILESSSSMLSLIGGLLDTSRIERGVLPISMSDIAIGPEIRDVWRILSVEKKKSTVEFELRIGQELDGLIIRTDRDRLRQVIINLTYNAFKFTDQGSVVISARLVYAHDFAQYAYPQSLPLPAGDMPVLFVSVADTGIGIPADKTEVIFEPFRRLANSKLKYGGMGLGLNIVRSVVQLLGGQVWVVSEVGVGSTFYFFIPIVPPGQESPEE